MSDLGGVIVIGGGLAGITAAIRLADQGRDVTVFETRPRLGGATYSFQRDGLTIDTGQHVLLRGYSRYRALLERLGVNHLVEIQRRLDLPVLRATHRDTRLRRSARGPAPFHLIPALAGYRALSPAERLRASLAAVALRKVDPDDPAQDATTFGDWLCRNGQGPRAISLLWGLLTVAALNIDPHEASLALAARVFRTGLLDVVTAGDLGISQVPLASLHDQPARNVFSRMGIGLHTGERVRSIERGGSGMTVRTDSGEHDASAVVVAVPHGAAARLVPEAASPDRRLWDELGDSPIVNAHILYDRRVTDLRVAAVLNSGTLNSGTLNSGTLDSGTLDSGTQWIFDRTSAAGVGSGQYLVSSISAADAEISMPSEQIRNSQVAMLASVLPGARRARVLDVFVTREPRATFRQRAGSARLRPRAATNWPSLVLAGAWTATGWPDTMEGAVLSGVAAADALAQSVPARNAWKEVIA